MSNITNYMKKYTGIEKNNDYINEITDISTKPLQ